MAKGIDLIAAERERQITEEGYTAFNYEGRAEDLTTAAWCYALCVSLRLNPKLIGDGLGVPYAWPWHPDYWKPTGDPVRDLTKAGALIAAAIDTLTTTGGK